MTPPSRKGGLHAVADNALQTPPCPPELAFGIESGDAGTGADFNIVVDVSSSAEAGAGAVDAKSSLQACPNGSMKAATITAIMRPLIA